MSDRFPKSPQEISDAYMRTLGHMMALIGRDYALRPAGASEPLFRFPPAHTVVVAVWSSVCERFCLNREALALARQMPDDATAFMMRIALCETGHPPRECTLADLNRLVLVVGQS